MRCNLIFLNTRFLRTIRSPIYVIIFTTCLNTRNFIINWHCLAELLRFLVHSPSLLKGYFTSSPLHQTSGLLLTANGVASSLLIKQKQSKEKLAHTPSLPLEIPTHLRLSAHVLLCCTWDELSELYAKTNLSHRALVPPLWPRDIDSIIVPSLLHQEISVSIESFLRAYIHAVISAMVQNKAFPRVQISLCFTLPLESSEGLAMLAVFSSSPPFSWIAPTSPGKQIFSGSLVTALLLNTLVSSPPHLIQGWELSSLKYFLHVVSGQRVSWFLF